jgi:3-hydroxy-3-methylglutaryl CoA synthase
MAGISAFGAYIPLWRLSREIIAREWGQQALPGEKAVSNFDEDSITMAVASALNMLKKRDRRDTIGGLYFASTSSPYKEKQASVVIAAACDLRRDILTSDYTNSLRASTQALRAALDSVKAGSAEEIIVTAADTRLGAPRSQLEMLFGDGAAALLVSDRDVVAEVEWTHSVYHEITDVWRDDQTRFIQMWEDRFVFEEGFLRSVKETVSEAMAKYGCRTDQYDRVIISAPDPRRHQQIAKMLGFDIGRQLQDGYFSNLGVTGCAHPLMMLVGALEEAKAEERLLLVSYGDGTDVLSLRVTERIEQWRDVIGVRRNLETKQMVPDYATYALWRGLVHAESAARRPPRVPPSSSAQWRERERILRLYGVRCNRCGAVQYPPQRVCSKCKSRDDFSKVRLAERRATLFTYAMDYIAGTTDIPHIVCIVNFEGGGRMVCSMTDRVIESIEVDMPLEMTFRKIFSGGGVHNYFWKCMPARN